MRFSMRAGYGDRVAGSHPAPLPQRGAGLARSGTGPFPKLFSRILGATEEIGRRQASALRAAAEDRGDVAACLAFRGRLGVRRLGASHPKPRTRNSLELRQLLSRPQLTNKS